MQKFKNKLPVHYGILHWTVCALKLCELCIIAPSVIMEISFFKKVSLPHVLTTNFIDRNKKLISDLNGIHYILRALKRFSFDANVVECCCGALQNLTLNGK